MDDELEVRLRLLEGELSALQDGISTHAARISQIKGWCLTIVSGLLFLAISQDEPTLLGCAAVAAAAFWLADSHAASIQRVMINRQQQIERHFLNHSNSSEAIRNKMLVLPGFASAFLDPPEVQGWWSEVEQELVHTWSEAKSPYRLLFYALTLVGIAVISSVTTIF